MDIFNNREIAIGIWLLVFAAFAISIRTVRASLPSLWNTLFCSQILVPLFLMITYIAIVVLILSEAGIWSTIQLKNTIFWTFSVAILSMFRIPHITEDENYFRGAIRDNFKFIAVFEFVVAFYTFSILVEMVIVPAVTLLVTLQAFSETERRYKQVARLLANFLTIFGLCLILYAGYMLATAPSSFFHADTLSNFILPIVLTILFLPFLFSLTLYAHYEALFTRITSLYQTEPERRRAKQTALFGFHIRTTLLKRWLRYVQAHRPREPDAFRRSVDYVKTQVQNEKNPPKVPICRGWSPYLASKFLAEMELSTGDYYQEALDASQWYSSSKYLDINGGLMPNNIAFYVEGDEHCANSLKLVANVNDIPSIQTLRIRYLAAVEKLMTEALQRSTPPELVGAINNEVAMSIRISGKRVDFVKESWPNQRGYELRFFLSNNGTLDTGRNAP